MEQTTAAFDLLSAARHDIDKIDDQILALLIERYEAASNIARISKHLQHNEGPLQPVREIEILRRLINTASAKIPIDDIVRLWRMLFSQAEIIKNSIRLACPVSLLENQEWRDILRDYFPAIPVAEHADAASALKALARSKRTIAVVPMTDSWPQVLKKNKAGGAQVIGSLPLVKATAIPSIAIIAHGVAEPTGDDETLVATTGRLPRDFVPTPIWQTASVDGMHLSCLPGYLSLSEGPLLGLKRSNPALAITRLGRYPSPIEV